MSAPLLQVVELHKSYGGLKVTNDVSFDVYAGEIHALIGPNGAGKSTLINQLSGTVASDGGSVFFDGEQIDQFSTAERCRKGLSRTFQIISLLQSFTVLENVATAFQARAGSSFRFMRDVSRDENLNAPAMALLSRFGLAERSAVLASNLSYGEKRQLELAVALATQPKVLLLDEPLAGTSHEEARQVEAQIFGLKGHVGVLLVEHDMNAVFSLADRVSVLVYGRLIATGTPAEIRANPAVRSAYLGQEAV